MPDNARYAYIYAVALRFPGEAMALLEEYTSSIRRTATS
jgi:hypothetical protein